MDLPPNNSGDNQPEESSSTNKHPEGKKPIGLSQFNHDGNASEDEFNLVDEKSGEAKKTLMKRLFLPFIIILGILTMSIFLMVYMSGSKFVFDKDFIEKGGSPIAIKTPKPGEKVLLMMGIDDARSGLKDPFKGARTDVMMLVRVSTQNQEVALVSIPRDSKVYLAGGKGIDKINAAHAYGGSELAVKTVEESFGIPVDNYVLINYNGIREIVDLLGGVDVYIEKRMRYRDRTANLNIDFQPGVNHLNGKEAEAFLRFRHDEYGDIGRIQRQQQFLSAVAKKLKSPMAFTKLPALVEAGKSYVKTDLDKDEMFRLAAFVPDLDFSKIRSATLPGFPSGGKISYWIIKPEEAKEVLDRLIVQNKNLLALPDSPLKVGIIAEPDVSQEDLDALIRNIEQSGFNVVCNTRHKKLSTKIVEHSDKTSPAISKQLKASDKRLAETRLIFAPVGTTFEISSCSSREDYTLIMGKEAF